MFRLRRPRFIGIAANSHMIMYLKVQCLLVRHSHFQMVMGWFYNNRYKKNVVRYIDEGHHKMSVESQQFYWLPMALLILTSIDQIK